MVVYDKQSLRSQLHDHRLGERVSKGVLLFALFITRSPPCFTFVLLVTKLYIVKNKKGEIMKKEKTEPLNIVGSNIYATYKTKEDLQKYVDLHRPEEAVLLLTGWF